MNRLQEIQPIRVDRNNPYKLVVEFIVFIAVCAVFAIGGHELAQQAKTQEWMWAGWVCCIAFSFGGGIAAIDGVSFAIYGYVKHVRKLDQRDGRALFVANW